MSDLVLIKFESDWADEFTVRGFRICTQEEWDESVSSFKNADRYLDCYFGTNEGWDDIDIHFLNNYKTTPISKQEAATIKKFFGEYYGVFPDLESLYLDEEEEEKEEALYA